MGTLHELCEAVRIRREDIGMSQENLARLAGVGPATVAEIEAGAINDIGFFQAAAILEPLGLRLIVDPAHPRIRARKPYTPPLEIAARTCSVSFRQVIATATLGASLVGGSLPVAYEPYVRTLLDEAPISLLAHVVEQIHSESQLDRGVIWANMRRLAKELKVRRDFWQAGI
jgi:transcriptional regulator with XRE-family HTH domain